MAVGFDSTPLAEEHITAGLHPFDRTARPQVVRKKDNLKYYNLIKAFEKLTGVGALMNTSFNIHGESIVGSPEDAIYIHKVWIRSPTPWRLVNFKKIKYDFLLSKIYN